MDGAIQTLPRSELEHGPDAPESADGGLPLSLRLTDAERIAIDRLKDATAGSLKEALATTIVAVPPELPATLTERLADVAPANDFVALMPFQAAPGGHAGWVDDAVPPAHTLPFFETLEEGAPREMHAPTPSPAEETIADARPSALVDTPASDPAPEDKASEEHAGEGSAAHAQELALRLLAPEHADTGEPFASAVGGEGARKAEEVIGRVSAATVVSLEARVREEFGLQTRDPQLDPIVSAFAANARLAADATAAVEALHHLKKLLVDKLAEEQQGEANPKGAAREAAAQEAAEPVSGEGVVASVPAQAEAQPEAKADTVQPPPIPVVAAATPAAPVAARESPALPLEPPPEELPQIVSRARAVPAAEPARTPPSPPEPIVIRSMEADVPRAASPALPVRVEAPVSRRSTDIALPHATAPRSLPAVASRRMSEPRPIFDVRGFVAGFMLSGAIGLLLYFVMVLAS